MYHALCCCNVEPYPFRGLLLVLLLTAVSLGASQQLFLVVWTFLSMFFLFFLGRLFGKGFLCWLDQHGTTMKVREMYHHLPVDCCRPAVVALLAVLRCSFCFCRLLFGF